MQQYGKTSHEGAHGRMRHKLAVGLGTALWLLTALLLGIDLMAGTTHPHLPASRTAPPASTDTSRFILNALLAPALDGEAVPLRWADPLPALHCGPETAVRVNGKPIPVGALVPDAPFELEWQTDGCHPLGAHGPRFDGRVRLMVFREDWGFSAMVQPSGLRVTSEENVGRLVQAGTASMPQCASTSTNPSC